MHRAGSVVAHHQHRGVSVGEAAEPPDVGIEEPIVLAAQVFPLVAGLVARVLRIDVAPERVMKSVDSDLHHHHEVWPLLAPHVRRDVDVLCGHRDDVSIDSVQIVRAKVPDICEIGSESVYELGLELPWEAPRSIAARPHEAGHHLAAHRRRRRGEWNEEGGYPLPMLAQPIPDAFQSHIATVHHAQSSLARDPVSKPVQP